MTPIHRRAEASPVAPHPHWVMALVDPDHDRQRLAHLQRLARSSAFRFPEWVTLGGDVEAALARHGDPGVATAIAWHFAAMWLLLIAYLSFMLPGAS